MIETNKIHQMDCIEGMRSMRAEVVDMVITSPPYNIGTSYRTYRDTLSREEYLDWMEQVAIEARRVLKKNGSFFLNIGTKPTDPWVAIDVANRFRGHYVLQNTIYWIKSIAIQKSLVGIIMELFRKPINSPRFLHDCVEPIFHFTKTGRVQIDRLALGVRYQDKSNLGRWKWARQDIRCRGNTWFIPYKTIQSRDKERPYPSTFPDLLPEMCIKLHGVNKAQLVLDPFTGLGSTAIACRRLGVDFIGFEIDEEYIREAEKRLSPVPFLRRKAMNSERFPLPRVIESITGYKVEKFDPIKNQEILKLLRNTAKEVGEEIRREGIEAPRPNEAGSWIPSAIVLGCLL